MFLNTLMCLSIAVGNYTLYSQSQFFFKYFYSFVSKYNIMDSWIIFGFNYYTFCLANENFHFTIFTTTSEGSTFCIDWIIFSCFYYYSI